MKSDDRKLIAAFQSGDYHAFDTLYERYAGRVLAFAVQITSDPNTAEDLAHEVFIGAFKGLQTFRNQSSVLTWLFSITVRRWRDKQRDRRLQTIPYPEDNDPYLLANASALHNLTPRPSMEMADLTQGVAQLNALLREAFLLVVVQQLTHREAAQVLECPLGTVKWRVAEALRQVRANLQTREQQQLEQVEQEQEKEKENVSCLLS